MRKLVVVFAVTLTLGAGVGLAQALTPIGGGGHDLVVVEKVVDLTTLDLGKPGIDQGDRYTYRSDLLDKDGKVIGTAGGECVNVTTKQGVIGVTNCVGYYNLAGGQLEVSGLFDFTEASNTLAIIGGTGDYAGARGTADYQQTSDDTYRDDFHLIG